jgi:hypothetical protein
MAEVALGEAFVDVGVEDIDPDVASSLLSLAALNGVNYKKLAELWESYVMSGVRTSTTSVQPDQLKPFGEYVRKAVAEEAGEEEDEEMVAAPPARTPLFAQKTAAAGAAARTPAAAPAPARTPAQQARHALRVYSLRLRACAAADTACPCSCFRARVAQAPAGATAFSARGSRMQPTPALNGHLAEAAPLGEDDPPRCEVALAAPELAALGSRYMRERLEDRVEYIEARALPVRCSCALVALIAAAAPHSVLRIVVRVTRCAPAR